MFDFQFGVFFYCAIFLVSRVLTREIFFREAYNCLPCCVRMENLTSVNVAQIHRRLIRPQRTRPKKKPASCPDISPKSKRRRDDNLFLPPVPIPVQTVDVQTMNNECKIVIYDCFNKYSKYTFSNDNFLWFLQCISSLIKFARNIIIHVHHSSKLTQKSISKYHCCTKNK